MADRVPSDHPTVVTVDATLVRQGRTARPKLVFRTDADPVNDADRSDDADSSSDADLPAGEVVRLLLDGDECHARFDRPTAGEGLEVRGAYDTPDEAREPGEGPNRLREWVDDSGLDFGRTVHLDVVEAGFRYGLREPGERTVYRTTGGPDRGLAAIAERVEKDLVDGDGAVTDLGE